MLTINQSECLPTAYLWHVPSFSVFPCRSTFRRWLDWCNYCRQLWGREHLGQYQEPWRIKIIKLIVTIAILWSPTISNKDSSSICSLENNKIFQDFYIMLHLQWVKGNISWKLEKTIFIYDYIYWWKKTKLTRLPWWNRESRRWRRSPHEPPTSSMLSWRSPSSLTRVFLMEKRCCCSWFLTSSSSWPPVDSDLQ